MSGDSSKKSLIKPKAVSTEPVTWSGASAILFGSFSFIMGQIVAGILLWIVYGEKITDALNNPTPLATFVSVIILGVITVGLIVWYVQNRGGTIRNLGYKRAQKKFSYWRVVYALLMYFGLLILARTVVAQIVPQVNLDQEQVTGFESVISNFDLWLSFLAIVVVAPIVEETLFRGFIFKGLRNNFSFWPAAIVSAGLFALAHGQLNVALDTFILGLFLAYLFSKSDSIWPSVILHASKNAIAFTVLFLVS